MRNLSVLLSLFAMMVLSCYAQVVVDGVVLRVNDDAITLTDVDREVRSALAVSERTYSGAELEANRPRLRSEALQRIIDRKIKASSVLRTLSDAQKRRLEQIIADEQEGMIRRIGSRAEFRRQLQNRGLTIEKHRELLKESILLDEARRRALSSGKVPVSPADVARYYEQHKDQFRQPPWVRMRQIMIWLKRHPHDEAQALINNAAARLRSGEDFAVVASELSEGPEASAGGLRERVEKGLLIPELDKLLFQIPLGKPSDIVQTKLGFHIVLVEERHGETVTPLEQVYTQIESNLRQERTNMIRRQWSLAAEKTALVEAPPTREQP